MAKFVWGVLCARAIVDQETNTVSFIDVIDNLAVTQFPATLNQATLSLMWRREKADEELVIRVVADWPGNTDKAVIEPEPQVMKHLNHRFNLSVNGIKIEDAGELKFIVKQFVSNRWKTVYKLSCPIIHLEALPSP